MSITLVPIPLATQPKEPTIVTIQGHKYAFSLTLGGSDVTHLGNWQSLADQAASFFGQHAEDYGLGTVHPPRPLSCQIQTNSPGMDTGSLTPKEFQELLNSSQEDLERKTYSIYSQVIGGTYLAEPIIFQAPNAVSRTPFPLERQLRNVALEPVDVHRKIPFEEYIEPNEGHPQLAQPYLNGMDPGYIISTGTERSFFDLALAPDQCRGLLMIDINDRVVAYNRFNILLLIISNTMEQYAQLSDPIKSETELQDRIEQIRNLANHSPHLSSELRTHYLKELENYAKAFFSHNANGKSFLRKSWKNAIPYRATSHREFFAEVLYQEKPELFGKLQRYARSGNMIAKLGDIGDLEFLGNLPIGLVDVSNIPSYQYLDFKAKHPIKIMSTIQKFQGSVYKLKKLETELTEEEKFEIREFFTLFKELRGIDHTNEQALMNQFQGNYFILGVRKPLQGPDLSDCSFISKELLLAIRLYKEQCFHCFPNGVWIERTPISNAISSKIWELEDETLQEFACSEKAKDWAESLAQDIPHSAEGNEDWIRNRVSKYLIFADLPGWKEEFGCVIRRYLNNLKSFEEEGVYPPEPIPEVLIEKAREWGLLDTAQI